MLSAIDRIEILLRAKGIPTREMKRRLADTCGVSYQAVSQWFSGSTKNIESAHLAKIAKEYGATLEWLVTGKNHEFTPVSTWDDETPLDSDEVEIPFYKEFLVSCGSGAVDGEATDSEKRKLRMSKKTLSSKGIEHSQAVAMTAKGDSMSPVINHGDTVFVDLGRNRIKDGKIFFFEHGGLFKFKYLYALPMGGVRVVSANSEEFPEERLTAQQVIDEEFKIIGWAFSWQTMDSW